MVEDEVARWHHRLHGHEFEGGPGESEGQESLECCSQLGHKELDATQQLNNKGRDIAVWCMQRDRDRRKRGNFQVSVDGAKNMTLEVMEAVGMESVIQVCFSSVQLFVSQWTVAHQSYARIFTTLGLSLPGGASG